MPAPSIAGLVAVGVLRRFSFGGCEDAALRTQHSFTLGARLAELTTVVDCWKTSLKHGTAPPASLFDGSSTDLSKLVGLKAVAIKIHEQGAIPFAEARDLFAEKRSGLLDLVQSRYFPHGGLRGSSASHTRTILGCDILRGLPVVAVPYRGVGEAAVWCRHARAKGAAAVRYFILLYVCGVNVNSKTSCEVHASGPV
jgi:hypothetical protein